MELTASELAVIVEGELIGDKNIILTGANDISEAKKNEISFLGNLKYFTEALKTEAGIIFVADDTDISKFQNKNIIKVSNPQYAYTKVLSIIEKEQLYPIERNVHKSVFIAGNAKVGKGAYIGHNVVIESGVEIGDDAKIFPNVYIGKGVKIGKDCLVYPNVVIRENTVIGNRIIIQSGAVIGGDGFGFVSIEGKAQKVPHIGHVEIGDDVEIGANTTIDRATTGATKIGSGTKIDNLVQIAHNVTIGQNCTIVAQTGISGSTHLGNNVIVGGQTGLAGHLKIGNNVTIASQSGISGNIQDNEQIGGNPMANIKQSIKIRTLMRKLPDMYQDLKKLKKFLGDKHS